MNNLIFFNIKIFLILSVSLIAKADLKAQENIALTADTIVTSYVSPWETLGAINDGYDLTSSTDKKDVAYGNWQSDANQDWEWVHIAREYI